ncbi:hypothetical protein [Baekduia soli]|uniref:hypothetical protein n=1 Tax=Baekduia soli TaxID=496014 RepID=UPI001E631CEB|nr:hypothetical protein [Baekduia soli]
MRDALGAVLRRAEPDVVVHHDIVPFPRAGPRDPLSDRWRRVTASVPASPHEGVALLEQVQLVMVLPERAKGVGKPFSERYRLQRLAAAASGPRRRATARRSSRSPRRSGPGSSAWCTSSSWPGPGAFR